MPGGEARQERDTSQRVPGNDRLKSYVPEEALGEARRRYDFPMGSPVHIGLKEWKTFSELALRWRRGVAEHHGRLRWSTTRTGRQHVTEEGARRGGRPKRALELARRRRERIDSNTIAGIVIG